MSEKKRRFYATEAINSKTLKVYWFDSLREKRAFVRRGITAFSISAAVYHADYEMHNPATYGGGLEEVSE